MVGDGGRTSQVTRKRERQRETETETENWRWLLSRRRGRPSFSSEIRLGEEKYAIEWWGVEV